MNFSGESESPYCRELRSFYQHLFMYIIVMGVLFIIDWRDHGNWWFYWPLLGWGIGIVAHAFSTFGVFGRNWEDRKVRQLMEKDNAEESDRPNQA